MYITADQYDSVCTIGNYCPASNQAVVNCQEIGNPTYNRLYLLKIFNKIVIHSNPKLADRILSLRRKLLIGLREEGFVVDKSLRSL